MYVRSKFCKFRNILDDDGLVHRLSDLTKFLFELLNSIIRHGIDGVTEVQYRTGGSISRKHAL